MANIVVRQIGPLVQALSTLRQSLYRPPQTVIAGIDESLWPNPLQPVTPIAPPNAEPLGFPLQWGQNINYTPRYDAEYSVEQLRYYAKYPLARICLENTKDMLCRMPFTIQLKPLPGETSKARAERSKGDDKLKKLNRFFERPNSSEDWPEFLRPVLEDMLVIDAGTIFMGRLLKDNSIAELRWIEGGSITRLVDKHGWTPPPPSPAYQQNWEGLPRTDYTTDQLVYRPRNISPRNTISSYLYGFSPTEQLADEIEIGIARMRFIKDFYTEGSIPGLMIFAPVGTPVDKIKEAQQWLDSELAGNLAKRRRTQILQGFQSDGKSEQLHQPKEPALTDAFDDLHIRKIAFGYGTSPQRLQRAMNRSSADAAQTSAEEEGTLTWVTWVKSTFDRIIQVHMGLADYEMAFDPFHELDQLKKAMADSQDIKIGLYTRNEKREARGDDPRPEPEADELNVLTGNGVLGLGDVLKPTTPGKGAAGASSGGPKSQSGGGGRYASITAAAKVNGHTTWNTCEKHEGDYPRSYCADCIRAELLSLENNKESDEEAQAQ